MTIVSFEEFSKQLQETIVEAQEYLSKRSRGQKGPGTVGQLEALVKYLKKIDQNVRTMKIPPQLKRSEQSLGWILVDGWDPKDPPGARILEVDAYYLNKL